MNQYMIINILCKLEFICSISAIVFGIIGFAELFLILLDEEFNTKKNRVICIVSLILLVICVISYIIIPGQEILYKMFSL